MSLQAIVYKRGSLKILDQTLLPHESIYIDIPDVAAGWKCINLMQVRGAPAIAIVGCLSLAVEILSIDKWQSKSQLYDFIREKLDYLVTSRPTAVNLKLAANDLTDLSQHLHENNDITTSNMMKLVVEEIESMLAKDVSDNKSIGEHGAKEILSKVGGKVIMLTHCNTGSLATAGYGTALGVIRALHSTNCLDMTYFCEARPYMQGSRLTSYELLFEKIPSTLICDSAVSHLFKTRQISAVVLGADRIAANGDTANKIGTYHIAVSAKHHGVPFYVAAPFSTIDFSTPNGEAIPIEERPQAEMTFFKGIPVTPVGTKCWNPAFDVTPAEFITGIITEKGVFPPSKLPKEF